MNKVIKAEPKQMDELDYLLLELNKSDDNRIVVVKSQVKAKFTALQSSNMKLIRKITILRNLFIDECISNDNINEIFEKIFTEYIDMKAEKEGDKNE